MSAPPSFGLDAAPGFLVAALAMAGLVGAVALPALRRAAGPRRALRATALAAALLGLLGLALRPWSLGPSATDTAVLVTPGDDGPSAAASGGAGEATNPGQANPRSAAADEPDAASASSPLRISSAAVPGGWATLPDARTLWRREPGLRGLEVRGYGLDTADLAGFTGKVIRFAPPPLPIGVMAALWPRRLPLGAPLLVEARTTPASDGRLELSGPGGVEDSADGEQARRGVTLHGHPKAAGRFLYRLVVRDKAGHEAAGELLDVTVMPPLPPRVVARFAAPSFESRALLRFLASAGVPYAASLELTRDRSRVESSWPAAFGPRPAVSTLDAGSLAATDVLLLDGRSWKALSAGERAAIAAAIEGGLGVLLFDTDPAAGEETGFPLRSRSLAPRSPGARSNPARGSGADAASVDAAGVSAGAVGSGAGAVGSSAGTTASGAGAAGVGAGAVGSGSSERRRAAAAGSAGEAREADGGEPAAAPGREERLSWPGQEPLPAILLPERDLAPAPSAEPLIRDARDRVVAARLRRGRGAVALSLVGDTYQWTLGADAAAHAALWTRLLGAIARPATAPHFILPGGPILVDQTLAATLVAPPGPMAKSGAGAAPAPEGARAAGGNTGAVGGAPADAGSAAGGPGPRITLDDGTTAEPLPVLPTSPGRHTTRFWPRAAGWLRLSSGDGATAWIYAAGPSAWRAWRAASRVEATRAKAAGGPAAIPPTHPTRVARPWPRAVFFALFLGGIALLWIDERLRAPRPEPAQLRQA